MNKKEGGQGRPSHLQPTAEQQSIGEARNRISSPARHPVPAERAPEGNALFSSAEQKGNNPPPSAEKQGKEVHFEITAREKYLLQVMAHIIAHGYLPNLANTPSGYPDPEGLTELILRAHIDKRTRLVPSEK
jgi:hypothetical protein